MSDEKKIVKWSSSSRNKLPISKKGDREQRAGPDLIFQDEEEGMLFQPEPPKSLERHRYIVSGYLMQNTALTRALRDPTCAHADLVERDLEYLRDMIPASTKNRATTRVEADLILDEHNGVLFYPLRFLGQTSFGTNSSSSSSTISSSSSLSSSVSSGLEELVYCIARIGPRYRVLWVVLEEYTWNPVSVSSTATNKYNRQALKELFHPPTKQRRSAQEARVFNGQGTSSSLKDHHFLHEQQQQYLQQRQVVKINPYAGPVM
ncbi:hypothetical protein BG004_003271, partial [Podila humilis]